MTRSIRGRLLLLAAVWLGAALLAAFLFISALLEDFVTGRFDAEAAALQAVDGGGTVTEVEVADEGDSGYEVEVEKDDGSFVEVALDTDGLELLQALLEEPWSVGVAQHTQALRVALV